MSERIFLGRAAKLALLLVLVGVVAEARSSSPIIGACCRPGGFLILREAGNFACGSTSKEQYEVRIFDLRQNESIGLPTCAESDDLILAEQQRGARQSVLGEACSSVFRDEASGLEFSAILRCAPILETVATPNSPGLDAPGPLSHRYRKCCPRGRFYDVELMLCIDGTADLGPLDGFVGAFDGPPLCEHALVDHQVAVNDVSIDELGAGLSISMPWKGQTKNITVNVDNACLDGEASSSHIVARVCSEADYCIDNPCIRKCCPENKINNKCLDPPSDVGMENFRTTLASIVANGSTVPTPRIQRYGLLIGRPCNLYYTLDLEETWSIGSLGELLTVDNQVFNYVNSCIEFMYNDPNFENGLKPFMCFDDDYYTSNTRSPSSLDAGAGLALTSSLFLSLTLLVYCSLPSLQNLHGKTLMCHAVSLLLAYGLLAANGLATRGLLDRIDARAADVLCKCIAYLMAFCFHSAFFWLNVMCFDIWWTFGQLRGQASAAAKRRRQRNTFLAYCVYAWGLAFVLTSLSALLLECTALLGSSTGRERCWFDYQSMAEVIFFIVPVTLTLIVNSVFFTLTSYRCSKVKAEIKRATAGTKHPSTRKFHSDRTRLIINLKLFVVMGIPWLLENIPAYLNHYRRLPAWLEDLLYVADVINSLQGLWIFVLFALKQRVYRALRERLRARFRASSSRPAAANSLDVRAFGAAASARRSASNSTLASNLGVLGSSAA